MIPPPLSSRKKVFFFENPYLCRNLCLRSFCDGPLLVANRARCVRLQPTLHAVAVERVVATPPVDMANRCLRRGALNATFIHSVTAHGARVRHHVVCPRHDGRPLLYGDNRLRKRRRRRRRRPLGTRGGRRRGSNSSVGHVGNLRSKYDGDKVLSLTKTHRRKT
jgi:hypothetical protein